MPFEAWAQAAHFSDSPVREDITEVFTAPRYMELTRPDEKKFLDRHGCGFLVCAENQVL